MNKPLHQPLSLFNVLKISILSAVGMISFFLLMNLINLHTILELRYINFLFIFIGVRHLLLNKQSTDSVKIKFPHAIMLGFLTVLFTAFIFSAFVFLFLNLDTTFMAVLKQSQPFGIYLSPASCAVVVYLEGIASGAIVSVPVLLTMKKENATSSETIRQLAN